MPGTEGRVGALPAKAEALGLVHVERLKQADWASPVLIISALAFSRDAGWDAKMCWEPRESRIGAGGH